MVHVQGFRPIGMPDTVVTLDADQQARLTPAHDADQTEIPGWHCGDLPGHAGLVSSARDLATLVQAYLADSGPLSAPMALAYSDQVIAAPAASYGLGLNVWSEDVEAGHQLRFAGGSTYGHSSRLAFDTAHQLGVVILTNTIASGPPLARFIADCLDKEKLYIYADPVANMIVNVGRPGTEFTWHFDTNEFTITMLLKAAQRGGHFEYAPDLRSADDECYDQVGKVLRGDRERVVRLPLEAGDLQLFLGRFSLHRVTKNLGDTDRLLLIMSFAERPGMIGSVHRTRTLYGKVTRTHLDAEKERVRNDSLMD